MSKICSKFLETYPHLDVSKAQLILAIRRVAEKEKAAGKKKIWRILPEYLSMVVKVDGITPWTSSLSASSTSLSSSSSASASGSSASSSSATKPPAAKKSRVAKPKGKAGGKMQFPAASLPKLVEYLAAAGKRGVRYNLVPRYNLHSNTTRESSIMMTKLFTLTNLMFIALLLLLITYYLLLYDD